MSNTYSSTFVASLIYASVIYHRHRHAKRHPKPKNAQTEDRSDDGPLAEDALGAANQYRNANGSPRAYRGTNVYGSKTDPDTAGTLPLYEYRRAQEMEGTLRGTELDCAKGANGGYKAGHRTVQELKGSGEVYELSDVNSIKSERRRPTGHGSGESR